MDLLAARRLSADLARLLARIGIGAVLLAHGLQKLNDWGYAGTRAGFESMGAGALALAGVGAGRISVDAAIARVSPGRVGALLQTPRPA